MELCIRLFLPFEYPNRHLARRKSLQSQRIECLPIKFKRSQLKFNRKLFLLSLNITPQTRLRHLVERFQEFL
jgi:hypothetical protein